MMEMPFRVGQKVRIYTPGIIMHGEIAKVDSVVKNLLKVRAYQRKRSPKYTIHLIRPDWLCTCEFWPHQLRKATKKEIAKYKEDETKEAR